MNTDLAEQLKAWRAGLSLGREQAAVRMGVSFSTYLRWEQGKAPRSLAALAAIRRELGAQSKANKASE